MIWQRACSPIFTMTFLNRGKSHFSSGKTVHYGSADWNGWEKGIQQWLQENPNRVRQPQVPVEAN